jgi:hypothetical protein
MSDRGLFGRANKRKEKKRKNEKNHRYLPGSKEMPVIRHGNAVHGSEWSAGAGML